jgi:hypothetical protein
LPRYFFHIRDADEIVRDIDGIEMPDLRAARMEARANARALLIEALLDGQLHKGHLYRWEIEIANDAGKVIETLPVRALLYDEWQTDEVEAGFAAEWINETRH